MATLGVLCPASPGHLNPMFCLCRELARRGHRLVFAMAADVEDQVRAAGFDFVPIGLEAFPPGSLDDLHEKLGRLKGLAALNFTLQFMETAATIIVDETPALFRAAGAEALIVDMAVPGGVTVADILGIPFVSVANALLFNIELSTPPLSFPWTYRTDALGMLRNRLGYKTLELLTARLRRTLSRRRVAHGFAPVDDINDSFSPCAQVSQQVAEFEFPRRQLPPHFHFCGPFHDLESRPPADFPWHRLDGRPLVYASLGTLQNRLLHLFRNIAAACADLPVQLVISLGGSAEPDVLGTLPGDPVVVRFAPQLELLRRAELVITHAGMNTTLESLAQGVPMVAIPITNDQPGVAARIVWSGSGLMVRPGQASPDRLRQAIRRVRAEPSFRENARRIARAMAASSGPRRAADVIEQVITTGQPVAADNRTAAVVTPG